MEDEGFLGRDRDMHVGGKGGQRPGGWEMGRCEGSVKTKREIMRKAVGRMGPDNEIPREAAVSGIAK